MMMTLPYSMIAKRIIDDGFSKNFTLALSQRNKLKLRKEEKEKESVLLVSSSSLRTDTVLKDVSFIATIY